MMDDRQLLEVFFSEIGFIGLHEIEQTAYHLYDSIEMTGTHLAFHHLVQTGKIELERGIHLLCGIHLFGRRGKQKISTYAMQQIGIALKVTRIFRQILFIVKLRRIDEHRYKAYVVLIYGALHQTRMTGMQGTHSGHQTNCFSLRFASFYHRLQLFFCCNYLHKNAYYLSKNVQS